MDLPGLDPTGRMIDKYSDAATYDQDAFQQFVAEYLGQIIQGLQLPWIVMNKNRTLEEDVRKSREMAVVAHGATVLWGEVSHSKTIDQMRLGLVARARQEATINNRNYAFAFSSSNKESIDIEFLRIWPNGGYTRMGDRTLSFTDQQEILGFFEDVAADWQLPAY